jgi:hypothetical protein
LTLRLSVKELPQKTFNQYPFIKIPSDHPAAANALHKIPPATTGSAGKANFQTTSLLRQNLLDAINRAFITQPTAIPPQNRVSSLASQPPFLHDKIHAAPPTRQFVQEA